MADWRETGFVPDSDNEEEDESQPHKSSFGEGAYEERRAAPSNGSNPSQNELDLLPGKGRLTTEDIESSSNILNQNERTKGEEICTAGLGANHTAISQTDDALLEKIPRPLWPSASGQAISVEDQLQAELRLGLQTIHEVLKGAIPPASPDVGQSSRSSSLLSEARSLPDDFVAISLAGRSEHSPNFLHENVAEDVADEPTPNMQHGGRHLRVRNPIQMHPFAIEDALYRQTLRDRGVRPIREPGSPVRRKSPEGFESQDQEVLSSSPVQSSLFDTPSWPNTEMTTGLLPPSQHAVTEDELLTTQDSIDDNEDLPDFADLLRESARHAPLSPRIPRRALPHNGFRVRTLNAQKHDSTSHSLGAEPMLDIPPSPPRSSPGHIYDVSASSNNLEQVGHVTPAGLPTPAFSSEQKSKKRLLVDLAESTDSSQTSSEGGDSSAHISQSSGKDDSQGFQEIRRRIKGVLPASWLKLDLKKQTKTKDDRPHGDSPTRQMEGKGVARRVFQSQYAANEREQGGREISRTWDDSASDTEHSAESGPDLPISGIIIDRQSKSPIFAGPDDVADDDAVDPMAPPRIPKKSRTARIRREQRLEKARPEIGKQRVFDRKVPLDQLSSGQRVRTRRSGYVQSKPKRRKLDHIAPHLSILDAPGFVQLPHQNQPQFMRVAARKARSETKTPRQQDPRQKFLKLATIADTEEVNHDLNDWRSGRIVANSTNTLTQRGRPQTISEENVLPLSLSSPTQDHNNTTGLFTDATLATRQQLSIQSRGRSTPLHRDLQIHLQIRRGQISSLVDRVTTRTSRQFGNRSGSGKLLLSSIQPRLAQLENPPESRPRGRRPQRENLKVLQLPEYANRPSRVAVTDSVSEEGLSPRKAPKARPRVTTAPRKSVPRQYALPIQTIQSRVENHRIANDTDSLPPGPETRTIAMADELLNCMQPLNPRTCYAATTFIGSRGLSKALALLADRDYSARPLAIDQETTSNHISSPSWTGDVADPLAVAIEIVATVISEPSADLRSNPLPPRLQHSLKSVENIIEYVGARLTFTTTVDRENFLRSTIAVIDPYMRGFEKSIASTPLHRSHFIHLNLLGLMTVLTFQMARISNCPEIGQQLRDRTQSMFKSITGYALSMALNLNGSQAMLRFLNGQAASEEWALEIGHQFPEISAITIIMHIWQFRHQGTGIPDTPQRDRFDPQPFMTLVREILHQQVSAAVHTPAREKLAYVVAVVCTLSPIFELDLNGAHVSGRRFRYEFSFWDLVCSVLEPGLRDFQRHTTTFEMSGNRQRALVNHKICQFEKSVGRRIFAWCVELVTEWGWLRPDKLVTQIAQMFSVNGMRNMFTNSPKMRPQFLEAPLPRMVVQASQTDHEFHSFLKLVILATKRKSLDSERASRIMSFVYELCPNNGQPLRGDQVLQLEDLEALQNRCDLYLVLYCAAPVGCRPRISQISDLVDVKTSHIEACRVILNTWSSLVYFHIKGPELLSTLSPFADWFKSMLKQTVENHRLARSEITDQLDRVGRDLDGQAKLVIEANQKASSQFLGQLIHAWRMAMQTSKDSNQLSCLATDALLGELVNICGRGSAFDDSISIPMVEELAAYSRGGRLKKISPSKHSLLRDELRKLLVGHFSVDVARSISFLETLVRCWFAVAEAGVARRWQSWDEYLVRSPMCWDSICSGLLGLQFKIYFVSLIIASAPAYYRGHRTMFLNIWLSAILRPDEALRYEHELTMRIIQNDQGNLLMFDMPYEYTSSTDKLSVTLETFIESRTSIVLRIVKNMNVILRAPVSHGIDEGTSKERIPNLVNIMTRTMKAGWRRLQHKPDSREKYEMMIRYVIDLVDDSLVDPWFVDGKELPLPRNSVERKFKLHALKNPAEYLTKGLVSFFLSYCEQSAVDGTQELFMNDLAATFLGDQELGLAERGPDMSIMRPAFLYAIVSQYISIADTAPGITLSYPIIKLLPRFYQRLPYQGLYPGDPPSISVMSRTTVHLLGLVKNYFFQQTPSKVSKTAGICSIHSSLIEFVHHAMLRLWDYLRLLDFRLDDHEDFRRNWSCAMDHCAFVYRWTCALRRRLPLVYPEEVDSYFGGGQIDDDDRWARYLETKGVYCITQAPHFNTIEQSIFLYCQEELTKMIMQGMWRSEGTNLYVIRGNSSRAVKADLSLLDVNEELAKMLVAADMLIESYEVVKRNVQS